MCGGEIIAFPDELEPTYVRGEIIIPQEETGRGQYEYNSDHSSEQEKKPISKEKEAKLEALRSRPRRRPDWTDMMKEVEQGAKLKHVECNDRSAPILPEAKAKGQFVYESEKDNAHNQLLKQIQQGVRLKKTRTNDRSRPVLDGLRKFRRQMTIEEQIQKSTSVADVVALAAEPDELDDIDKVRDDLQSAKQMLALELRNKEGLERENKRLMARLLNLEVELEKEKATKHIESETGGAVVPIKTEEDEKLIQKLKEEAAEAAAVAKEMEDKYQKIAEELDTTRAKLESAWLRNQQIDLQLKAYEKGSPVTQITKQPSSKKLAASMASMPNGRPSLVPSEQESEYEEETEESESEEDTDDKDSEAAQERRQQREMKLLTTKVKSFKSKMNNALKERHKLKDMLKKQQKMVREEKKKYKLLQKEVDKMAKLMKDVDEEDLEEEEEDDEKDVEEEETETESESEESEEENDDSDDECLESATPEDRKKKLNEKAKRYENRLSSLKKGNYLLKANIDRLQDDLNRQKEMSLALQEDLNSVLSELG
ncbi:hypothetical protein LSTR_LSTR011580 [Laodelphax striatellus]|uniref:WH2 domain-containing protein n=1 Tax=Laodelphax striatellus TaxID=195883 RepID=A0A482X5Q3_LAOST|nr:hypothetical protein LSTR_LSTR011580 [Laodelphax striatellus]